MCKKLLYFWFTALADLWESLQPAAVMLIVGVRWRTIIQSVE